MYEYRAHIIKVVDGDTVDVDTVDVDIDLDFGIVLSNERVRINSNRFTSRCNSFIEWHRL
jgi:hypothetical protein